MTDTHMEDDGILDHWDDRDAARKISGIYANRVFVQLIGEGMVRINFGQIFDEEPTYHSAIVVSAENAAAFGELIARYGNALLAPIVMPAPAPTTPAEAGAVAKGEADGQ